MPKWTPSREWKDQDAFIIGGGDSLRGFDFQRLQGRNVIGCNAAFEVLGPDIVSICIFGDTAWFHKNKWKLEKFRGRSVSCNETLNNLNVPWLLQLSRSAHGLSKGARVGWNYNTGAAALNLALILGASRTFLLGFDMRESKEGNTHWHNCYAHKTRDTSFQRYIRGFNTLAQSMSMFPAQEVYNVTDGSSRLPFFPRIGFDKLNEIFREDLRWAS